MNKNLFVLSLMTFTFLVFFAGIALAKPNGVSTLNEIKSERASADNATANNATAGNVTELTIFGYSTTQSWQGYFGNVTGTIQLADADDNIMYNWSQASPQGEIYASTNSSLQWTGVSCYILNGSNITDLEDSFNINSSAADGVDETFNRNDHAEFYTNSIHFTAGQCNNTKVYDNTGTGAFDEVLLTDSASNIIFASILQEDATGFDSNTHDFEMLVLEDGHNGDTQITTYYFWVELE